MFNPMNSRTFTLISILIQSDTIFLYQESTKKADVIGTFSNLASPRGCSPSFYIIKIYIF